MSLGLALGIGLAWGSNSRGAAATPATTRLLEDGTTRNLEDGTTARRLETGQADPLGLIPSLVSYQGCEALTGADEVLNTHWTLNGSPALITGAVGNGLSIAGNTNDALSHADATLALTGSFSYAFWYQYHLNAGNHACFARVLDAGGWQVLCYQSDLTIVFRVYRSTGASDEISLTIPNTVDAWVHLAFTYTTSGGGLKAYLNGVLAQSGPSTGTPKTGAGVTYWNHDGNFTNNYGALDELGIFSTALTAQEVAYLYGS